MLTKHWFALCRRRLVHCRGNCVSQRRGNMARRGERGKTKGFRRTFRGRLGPLSAEGAFRRGGPRFRRTFCGRFGVLPQKVRSAMAGNASAQPSVEVLAPSVKGELKWGGWSFRQRRFGVVMGYAEDPCRVGTTGYCSLPQKAAADSAEGSRKFRRRLPRGSGYI